MSLFSSTARFYGAYRSDVPRSVAEVLDAAAPRVARTERRRLLDVGTGTGFVIRVLAPFFDDCIGVDPDGDLLAVAHQDLAPLLATGRARLLLGTAEEFSVPDGWRADLVTVCRAFHWFDRPRFLQNARRVMTPSGTLAVFGDRSVWAANAPWKTATLEIVREFTGPERRAGSGAFRAPRGDFADDLTSAGFHDVRRHQVPIRRTRTVESLIGYLHSTSFASIAVLGTRAGAFDDALRRRLTPFTRDGVLVDENAFDILTGRLHETADPQGDGTAGRSADH